MNSPESIKHPNFEAIMSKAAAQREALEGEAHEFDRAGFADFIHQEYPESL